MTTLERLESWVNSEKPNRCSIAIDDGYGATCWRVRLFECQRLLVEAWECCFIGSNEPAQDHLVFVMDEDYDDWAGLEATINAALDKVNAPK